MDIDGTFTNVALAHAGAGGAIFAAHFACGHGLGQLSSFDIAHFTMIGFGVVRR